MLEGALALAQAEGVAPTAREGQGGLGRARGGREGLARSSAARRRGEASGPLSCRLTLGGGGWLT